MDIKITVYLTEITSTDDVREYTIEKENTILGRDEAADIVIEIKKISRQHAVITCIPLGHTIKDLGSHNGTFVNGNKLGKEPELLKDQDKIVLGGVIAFRFHDQNATSSGPNIGNLFGIWIDEKNRSVWVDAIMVDPPLTAAQYRLLYLLYQNKNQIVAQDQIINEVWPGTDASGVSDDAIRSLVKRVRERLFETSPKKYLEVVHGQGLRLREE